MTGADETKSEWAPTEWRRRGAEDRRLVVSRYEGCSGHYWRVVEPITCASLAHGDSPSPTLEEAQAAAEAAEAQLVANPDTAKADELRRLETRLAQLRGSVSP